MKSNYSESLIGNLVNASVYKKPIQLLMLLLTEDKF